jgi:hypothetical protein
MITHWLTYIRLFDFDIRYIQGTKNGAADALSRRGTAPEDSDNDDDDMDDYFDMKIYNTSVSPISFISASIAYIWLINDEYSGSDLQIGIYLEILQQSDGMDNAEFRRFKRKVLNFLIHDGYLFKRPRRPGAPSWRVIGTQ